LKGAHQGACRLLLARRIHSGGCCLRKKERASAVSREPDAMPRGRSALTGRLGEAAQFAGRIARKYPFERRSFERREPLEVFTQGAESDCSPKRSALTVGSADSDGAIPARARLE